MANVNVVYGSTGQRSMFMGMDLTCEMGVAHALGERPPIEKDVVHQKGVYVVADLLREMNKPSKPKLKENPTDKECVEFADKLNAYTEMYAQYSASVKYNLMLNMMMREGVVDRNTKVKVGSNGRLHEVYLVKAKEGYRMFGKTYYGKI